MKSVGLGLLAAALAPRAEAGRLLQLHRGDPPKYISCTDSTCRTTFVWDRCAKVDAVTGATKYSGSSGMSRTKCALFCTQKKSFYFLVTEATDCWCAASYSVYTSGGPANCNKACPGKSSETCGGKESFDIFILGLSDGSAPNGENWNFLSPATTSTTTTTTTTVAQGPFTGNFFGECESFSLAQHRYRCSGGDERQKMYFGDGIKFEECQKKCESRKAEGCCESRADSWGSCTFFPGGQMKLDQNRGDTKSVMCRPRAEVLSKCPSFDGNGLGHVCGGSGDESKRTFLGSNLDYETCSKKCKDLGKAGCCESRSKSWGSCLFVEDGAVETSSAHLDAKAVVCTGM